MRIKSASFEPRRMREALKRLDILAEEINRELSQEKKEESAEHRSGFWARLRAWLLS